MSEQFKRTVLAACRRLLRPVARLMLAAGITWKEFAEQAKSVFVDVATREYGIGGRPTNASRVSILTGLSRREVARLRNASEEADAALPAKTTDATRVLSGWHQDPDYADDAGRPRPLPVEGPAPSFQSLHRRHGGDIPASAMLKELVKVGAVRRLDDGRVEAAMRFYMPTRLDPELALRAGAVMEDLGDTVTFNLTQATDGGTRFEGRASEFGFAPGTEAEFRTYLEQRGMAFLEEIDAWLAAHRAPADAARTTPVRLGVGVYQIHQEPQAPLPRRRTRTRSPEGSSS
jgi:hypothetical protein